MRHETVFHTFTEIIGRAIEAEVVTLTPKQIALCAEDLEDMNTSESFDWPEDTVTEWLNRIGGWRNVPSYARTLEAGAARRG